MTIQKVTIAGAGTLGSQIAYQSALCGYQVKIWNPHPERAEKRIAALRPLYKHDLKLTDEQFDAGLKNIESITNDWQTAFNDADLVIEAVPENLDMKKDFYAQLCQVLPKDAIIASNSSTYVPSQLVKLVDRPEKFLHLHFANHIWVFNTAEIVGNEKTDPAIIDEVVAFAKGIKMLPIVLKKEQHGYIMNALSVPFLNAALGLWGKGVADPITIDKDWMNSTGSPMGPFMSMDVIGLRTVWAIFSSHADTPAQKAIADKLKAMIDAGHYGVEAGEGFYTYPHPAYEDPNFLKE